MQGKKATNLISGLLLLLKVTIPLAILAGSAGIYFYLKSTKPKIPAKAQTEKAWSVYATQVVFENYQPALTLYGEVVAGRKVDLRALVAGEIIKVSDNLRTGGIVAKGETLLQIDPFKYEGALRDNKASLRSAKAKLNEILSSIEAEKSALIFEQEQLEIAVRDLTRAVQLSKDGTVSKRVVDDRKVLVSQRTQNVEKRKNNLEIELAKAEQQRATIERWTWSVEQAERDVNDTTLASPFEAYVSDATAQAGRIVSANDNVATLLDKNWVDVKFTLSDAQYGRILAAEEKLFGRDVQIRWRVGIKPLLYNAKIERVNPIITSESGGVELFARVSNPNEGAPLKPGAFVEVLFPDRHYKNIVRLPQTSLFDTTYVYLIKKNRLVKEKIELVGAVGNHIFVRGELKGGDTVLLTRLSNVGTGLKVNIIEQPNIKAPEVISKTSVLEKS